MWIYFGMFVRFTLGLFCLCFVSFFLSFRFSSGPAKCRILQHFLEKNDELYTSLSKSPASFSTSPACPTNIPSITNKSWVTNLKSSWRVDGVEKMMIPKGGHFTRCKENLKVAGGHRGAMIQERVRENIESTGRVGGGGFPYDFEEVHTYKHTNIHSLHRYIDYIKCRILKHFLAK